MALPTLTTSRLALRGFVLPDAPRVRELAGKAEVALTTQNIPHPYEDGIAEEWIRSHAPGWDAKRFLTLAMTHATDGVVGAVTLHVTQAHRRGELGYWVGYPYWNRGFATEASSAMVAFGFSELRLNRIQARHMARNPASGRVMRKLGMRPEGVHRQSILVRGAFEDIAMFAILRSDSPLGGA